MLIRFTNLLSQVIGYALIFYGVVIVTSARVTYARKHPDQPIFPDEIVQHLQAQDIAREGLFYGGAFVVLGLMVLFIRNRLLELKRHLASRR